MYWNPADDGAHPHHLEVFTQPHPQAIGADAAE